MEKIIILTCIACYLIDVCFNLSTDYFLVNGYADLICPSSLVEFQQTAASTIACLSLCFQSSDCSAVVFQRSQKSCSGLSKSHRGTDCTTGLDGAKYYTNVTSDDKFKADEIAAGYGYEMFKELSLSNTSSSTMLGAFALTKYHYSGQWVKSVKGYSSQGLLSNWQASHIVGSPDTAEGTHGGPSTCWSPGRFDWNANQYITVQFASAMYVTGIDIHETFNSKSVKRVSAVDANNVEHVLWQTDTVEYHPHPRVFSPAIEMTDFKCSVLKLYIDSTAANYFTGIDAVKMRGILW